MCHTLAAIPMGHTSGGFLGDSTSLEFQREAAGAGWGAVRGAGGGARNSGMESGWAAIRAHS